MQSTVACPVAKLTLAAVTPGTRFRTFSTRPTQAAQCIPSMRRGMVFWDDIGGGLRSGNLSAQDYPRAAAAPIVNPNAMMVTCGFTPRDVGNTEASAT